MFSQINVNDFGFSYSTNLLERSICVSSKGTSFEGIAGPNKTAYTINAGVEFKNRTAGRYTHEYFRTIPTGAIVVGAAVACYYTGGTAAAFFAAIFGGLSYAY